MNPNYCTIVVSEPDGPFMLPQGQALDSVNFIMLLEVLRLYDTISTCSRERPSISTSGR